MTHVKTTTLTLDNSLVVILDESMDYDDVPGVEQYLIEKLGDIGISASKVVLYDGRSQSIEGHVVESGLTK